MQPIYIIMNKNHGGMLCAFTKEEDATAYVNAYNKLEGSSFDYYFIEEVPLLEELIPITLGEGD